MLPLFTDFPLYTYAQVSVHVYRTVARVVVNEISKCDEAL